MYKTTPLSICSNTQKRNRKLGWSPVKSTPVKSPPKKKSREGPWTDDQDRSLIEFVTLHTDLQTSNSEWPSMRSDHVYWIKAAEYIQMIDGSTRSATSCRSRIVNKLRTTYSTISEAEDAYSCDYEDIREVSYDSGFLEPENITSLSPASDVIEKVLFKSLQRLDVQQSTELIKQFFQQNSEMNKNTLPNSLLQEDNLLNIYHIFDNSDTITACQRNEMVLKNFVKVSSSDKLCLLDTLFKTVCAENGIKQPPEKFPSLSLKSMDILQKKEKPNVLLDFAKCLGTTRPESDSPLMPVDRMPFGLIQYQLQFFSNSNTKKVFILIKFSYMNCLNRRC
ncbi:uncharacterized protein LOC134714336 [Mytilus trossulus]|uniref:uncharacterized protein LOC134714336 n=1 Tax=Mytilus trossulus TaxID=6551 RepID=UPI0030042E1C